MVGVADFRMGEMKCLHWGVQSMHAIICFDFLAMNHTFFWNEGIYEVNGWNVMYALWYTIYVWSRLYDSFFLGIEAFIFFETIQQKTHSDKPFTPNSQHDVSDPFAIMATSVNDTHCKKWIPHIGQNKVAWRNGHIISRRFVSVVQSTILPTPMVGYAKKLWKSIRLECVKPLPRVWLLLYFALVPLCQGESIPPIQESERRGVNQYPIWFACLSILPTNSRTWFSLNLSRILTQLTRFWTITRKRRFNRISHSSQRHARMSLGWQIWEQYWWSGLHLVSGSSSRIASDRPKECAHFKNCYMCKVECHGSSVSTVRGGGEVNICHVVYAWRMLASDAYWRTRACGGCRILYNRVRKVVGVVHSLVRRAMVFSKRC